MGNITAKIISAITNEKGVALITIEFDDGVAKWKKEYKSSNTTIRAQQFKDMVIADIRKDLNTQTQLTEVAPLVGKTFQFTV